MRTDKRGLAVAVMLVVSGVACTARDTSLGLDASTEPEAEAMRDRDDSPELMQGENRASTPAKERDLTKSGSGTNGLISQSRASALNRFPVRPLYRSPTEASRLPEQWYTSNSKYPKMAYLAVAYDPGERTFPSYGLNESKKVIGAGGLDIFVWYYPDQSTAGTLDGRAIRIRDQQGYLQEWRTDPKKLDPSDPASGTSSFDVRQISWAIIRGQSQTTYMVHAHPDRWSNEQLINWVNALEPIN